ncbi:MAG TPA: hypothetical protein VFV57_04940 [Limnobacter sp.]|nr:hypothetical protein [Limnobacter sp.]
MPTPVNPALAPFAQHPAGNAAHAGQAVVSQTEWDATPAKQRVVQFKAQIDQVHMHWNTILDCMDHACTHTKTQLAALRNNETHRTQNPAEHQAQLASLTRQLELRQAAWQRTKAYVSEQTAPKMLDLFYLNQTRQHLQTIAQAVSNPALNRVDTLAELVELSHGLGVCKEGVALNIMECAGQLHRKTLPNKLHAVFQQSREELLQQLLLRAVRTSHASVSPPEAARAASRHGTLTGLQESESLTMKSLEIHDVQALRNALSDTLGLEYVADRHISRKYESEIGQIARAVIPALLTPRAVARVMAEKIHQRTQQLLDLQGPAAHAGPNFTAIETALQEEFGVGVDTALDPISFQACDVDGLTTTLLQQRYPDIAPTAHAAAATPAQQHEAMQAFLGKGKLVSDRNPVPLAQHLAGVYQAMQIAAHTLKTNPLSDNEKKRQAEAQLGLLQDAMHRATRSAPQ